jgi:hypothetical protein
MRYDRWTKEIEVDANPENPWKEEFYERIERLKKRKYELQ